MANLSQIQKAHTAFQDSLLEAFERQLSALIAKAQSKTLTQLQKKLSITDGVVDQTPGNMRVLRTLNKVFLKEMDTAGFPALLESFAGEFTGHLEFVEKILQYLSDQMETPLPPVKWTGADLDVLSGFQANTVASIEAAVETAAGAAMTRGMFSVGGLKFGDLVETLQAKFQTSIAQAATLAETSQSTFYRVAADRQYQAIEREVPGQDLKYFYGGPHDLLERIFCKHLTDVNKDYTREQIDKMDNGQFPIGSVFQTAGGWRCRHGWLLSSKAWEAAQSA
jgi:hypothetical protein